MPQQFPSPPISGGGPNNTDLYQGDPGYAQALKGQPVTPVQSGMGVLDVARGLGAPAPTQDELVQMLMSAARFVGPQADVIGMKEDAAQVVPALQEGDYAKGLSSMLMAGAAIPMMAVPGTVSSVKGGVNKIPKGQMTKTGWSFKDVDQPKFSSAQKQKIQDELSIPRYKEVDLPIRSMIATQDSVNADFVEATSRKTSQQIPTVVKSGGKYFVRDGHHRLVAASADGDQTAKVALVDLDKTDVSVPLLDWERPRKMTKEDNQLLEEIFKDLSE